MPDRVVRGRRDPLLLAVCVGALVSSISYLSGVAPPPGSVVSQMPGPVLVLWYALMIPGGAIGLAGAAWPRRRLLAVVELSLAALTFLSTALVMFLVAVIAQLGLGGLGGGAFLAALAGACIWRGCHCLTDIRIIRKIIKSDGELARHKEPPPP